MDDYGSNKIIMRLKFLSFLHRVVIIYSDLEVIRSTNDPLLLNNESDGSDGICGCFNSSDAGLNDMMYTLVE